MLTKRIQKLIDPLTHRSQHEGVGHYVRERAGLTIGGIVVIGALVALTIWVWPEVQRTIKIHRM